MRPGVRLSGGFAFRRRGEIRLNTDEESRGKPTSFLQGVVEKRRIYSLGLSYFVRPDLFLKLDTAYIDVSNMENISGRSEGLLDLTLLVSFRTRWF